MKHLYLIPQIIMLLLAGSLLQACAENSGNSNGTATDLEPNDSFEAATPLALKQSMKTSLLGGEFTQPHDHDYFVVSTPPNTKVKILVENHSDANFLLNVSSADRGGLAEDWYPGKSSDATCEIMNANDKFYICVSGKDGSEYPADYTITVEEVE